MVILVVVVVVVVVVVTASLDSLLTKIVAMIPMTTSIIGAMISIVTIIFRRYLFSFFFKIFSLGLAFLGV